jgi:RNA polymerase sigma factor (sigma-70 family)
MFLEEPNKSARKAPSDGEELALLARARDGDEEALTALLAIQAPMLRKFIRISPKWQSVFEFDDVIQMTFIEVFLRMSQFVGEHPRAFRAWLLTIARNNVRAAIRGLESTKRPHPDRRVTGHRSEDESHARLLHDLGTSTGTPGRMAVRRETATTLTRALELLPVDYAGVIRHYYYDGLSGEELALRMNRSRGAAYMLLARARDRLAEIMGSPSKFFSDTP